MAGLEGHDTIQKRITKLGRAINDKEVLVAWRGRVGPEFWDVCDENTGRCVMPMVEWLQLPMAKRRRLASEYRTPEVVPSDGAEQPLRVPADGAEPRGQHMLATDPEFWSPGRRSAHAAAVQAAASAASATWPVDRGLPRQVPSTSVSRAPSLDASAPPLSPPAPRSSSEETKQVLSEEEQEVLLTL